MNPIPQYAFIFHHTSNMSQQNLIQIPYSDTFILNDIQEKLRGLIAIQGFQNARIED